MTGLDLLALIKNWGWRAVVTGVAVLFIIEITKPLIRKMIKNEQGRHAFYSFIDVLLIAIMTYAWMAIKSMVWAIDWIAFGTAVSAAYTVLKLIYPAYSNLGPQACLKALFTAIFKHKKEIADEVKKQEDETKKVIEL